MVFTVAVRIGDRRTGRRTVLAAVVGLAGLSACQQSSRKVDWRPGPWSAEAVLAEAVALAGRHAATIAAHPALAGRLSTIRDAHLAHADLLARTIGRRDLASPTADAASAAASGPAVPADAAAATAALLAAEKSGAERARTACLSAPAWQAGTLGPVAAARATFVAVLTP
jgi:hypothetical protein